MSEYHNRIIKRIHLESNLRKDVVMWAMDAHLQGRADSELNQRRILMYMATRIDLNMLVTIDVPIMETDLGIQQRTIRRSLDKLQDAVLIERVGSLRSRFRMYRLLFPIDNWKDVHGNPGLSEYA